MSLQALSVMTTVTLQTSVFLFVQIFSCYLVISTHGLCGPDEYPISGYPGGKCLHCAKCQEGQGLVPKCGTPIVFQVDKIDCKPCESGKFSDEYDSSSCHVCHQCVENEKVTKHCTNTSDTVCSGTCEKGFYFSQKDGTYSCHKCSHCCFDGQDEEATECKQQGFSESKQYCAPRPDKDCSPPGLTSPPRTGGQNESDNSNTNQVSQTTVIVVGVCGALVVMAAAIIATYFCHKRRERTKKNQTRCNYASDGPAADLNDKENSAHFDKAPQKATSESTSYGGQAIQSSASFHATSADVSVHITKDPGANNSASASCGKNILMHQKSKDSQRSGGDDAVNHRRSSSVSNVAESMKRKISLRREPSLVLNEEQDIDEVPGPIRVLQDLKPSPQEKKEGSKVEFVFKCATQGRDCKLIYKWFKDGVELPGRNNENTLRLKSVTLREFGWYRCRVSCEGNSNDCKESSSSELIVTPRDGTKYKCLTDVHRQDLETYERVGRLLSQKKHSLGGWREVAFKYRMDQLAIDDLESDPEAGKKTLGFLEAVMPELTVYDFCKALKEHNIRRLDIVQELVNHLSAPGTAYV